MNRKKKWKWLIRALVLCSIIVILLIACIYSIFWLGFPANKDGLVDLNRCTGGQLSERKVFVFHEGWMDLASLYRLNATTDEVLQIATITGMKKVKYSGGSIYWPPTSTIPYWWDPKPKSIGMLFRKGHLWTMYYEPDQQVVYILYWET